jgi:hypothetical protein
MPEENGGDFETVPEDTYVATCNRLIDLGTQEVEYEGKVKHQPKILVGWELTDALMSDGRPFTMQKRYTLSSSEKSTLRKDLESWRGVKFTAAELGTFSLTQLLGKSCMMGVKHETKGEKTYANISSLLRLIKGTTVSKLVNPVVHFDLSNFDKAVYESLSDNLRALIAKSPEYQALGTSKQVSQLADDDTF